MKSAALVPSILIVLIAGSAQAACAQRSDAERFLAAVADIRAQGEGADPSPLSALASVLSRRSHDEAFRRVVSDSLSAVARTHPSPRARSLVIEFVRDQDSGGGLPLMSVNELRRILDAQGEGAAAKNAIRAIAEHNDNSAAAVVLLEIALSSNGDEQPLLAAEFLHKTGEAGRRAAADALASRSVPSQAIRQELERVRDRRGPK